MFPGNWRDNAACRHVDPELFFPVSASGPALLQIEEAKRICQPCLVRVPCLSWALDHVAAGIWGGLTEKERRGRQRAGQASVASN